MINRIIMELYDDYECGNKESLINFAKKTFPNNGTDKLFVGCMLIMFKRANGFKPRYDCNREILLSIVKASKEKIGTTNLLAFYLDRINDQKGIHNYLKDLVDDLNLDTYADCIIQYLEQFKPDFINEIKSQNKKIEKYLINIKKKDSNEE